MSVKQDIQDIVKWKQQLGMSQEFCYEDIKLLLKVVSEEFSWYSEHSFQESNLKFKEYIIKAWKKPLVPIYKELH